MTLVIIKAEKETPFSITKTSFSMGFLQSLSRWRTKTADSAVALTSGERPIKALDTPQAYRLILVIGLAAVLGSGWFVYRSIVDVGQPAAFRSNTNNANTTTVVAELAKLRDKDTDGDSLDDYSELFQTSTSPYLKDSDSDGQSDSAEVNKGTDPNCPAGKACSGTAVLTTPTDATGDLSPEFLRQALRQAGVALTTLDGLSDDDLRQLYQNVLQENSASPNTNTTTTTLTDLNNLQPAEIRKLLTESGVDAATLQSIDDATLRQIFLQGINTSN